MSSISRHSQRYASTLRWLLADAFRRDPWRSVLVLCGSFLGALSHGAVFGLLVTFARALEANEAMTLGPWTVSPREERTVMIMGGVTLAMLLGSAMVICFSRRLIVSLVVAYYKACSQQVLRLYGARADAKLRPSSYRQVLRALKKRSSMDAKLCGKSLRVLLGAIVPLLTVVWTTAVMAWIDGWATAGVYVLVAMFLGVYYAVNRRVVQNQHRYEQVKPLARAAWIEHAQRTRGHMHWTERHERDTQELYDAGDMRASLEAYGQRLLATVHADFVGNILLALGIAGVLAYLGSRAIGSHIGWSEFFAYLITARIAISSVRSVFTSLTAFSKLYPFVRRYFDFVQSAPQNSSHSERVSQLTLAVAGEPILGGRTTLSAQPGDRIAVLTPVEINRYTVFYFAECLAAGDGAGAERIVRSIHFVHAEQVAIGQVSVREFAHLPASWTAAEVDAKFNGVHLGERLRAAGFEDLSQVYRRREFKDMGESLRHELLLAAAAVSDAGVVIIEHSVLSAIDEPMRKRWLELLADRIVLIHCGEEPQRVGAANETAVCVATGEGVEALGNVQWLREHEEGVRALMTKVRGKDAADGLDDDEEDEDLLDDEV